MALHRALLSSLLMVSLAVLASGCQTLREVANLRDLEYALGDVARADLAGVDLAGVRTYNDLRTRDVLRISAALADGRLPLQFQLNVLATNPEANGVRARMVEFDWTLFIEDRETVSGVLQENFIIAPGETQTVEFPLAASRLAYWDAEHDEWVIETTPVELMVGASSEDIRQRTTVEVVD